MLQSPLSSVCGQYCIYFLHHRARGIPMSEMVKYFHSNLDDNDQYVYDVIGEHYKLRDVNYLDTMGIVQKLGFS
jgi:hypothetical protein